MSQLNILEQIPIQIGHPFPMTEAEDFLSAFVVVFFDSESSNQRPGGI